jgi:pyruvate/2-oxoglutarate/acetoin dehydrogenase E1 component
VYSTPISESGIVGIATGMALRGLRPVVEIMFGDFVTLAADQLVNHAAKFHWMYNEQVNVPLTLRTPMGGRRGYGPTHSQTLEKLYLGIPGLRVVAPGPFEQQEQNAGSLLRNVILSNEHPTLFIENKLLYLQPIQRSNADQAISLADSSQDTPTYTLEMQGAPAPELTIATYGYMAELARQAMIQLAYEHEIFIDVVAPTSLSPFEPATLIDHAARSGRLLTVEESSLTMGWGAEILARTAEALGPGLKRVGRVAASDTPIPASGAMEARVLPGVSAIVEAVINLTR